MNKQTKLVMVNREIGSTAGAYLGFTIFRSMTIGRTSSQQALENQCPIL